MGLFLHDINFYDGSSEILIAGMQHARTLQAAIDKQQAWITKLQGSKHELVEWRRKGKRLLYNMMPRHIAQMLQEGVLANSICEVSGCAWLDDVMIARRDVVVSQAAHRSVRLLDRFQGRGAKARPAADRRVDQFDYQHVRPVLGELRCLQSGDQSRLVVHGRRRHSRPWTTEQPTARIDGGTSRS